MSSLAPLSHPKAVSCWTADSLKVSFSHVHSQQRCSQLTRVGFGADPYLNGALAVEAVTAIQSTGTITSLKVRLSFMTPVKGFKIVKWKL